MKKFNKYYLWWAGFAALYAGLVLATPPDKAALAKYGLSVGQVKLLGLTFLIPIVLIWLVAIHGLIAFKRYAHNLGEGADKRPMAGIGQGLKYLVISLPLTTVISSALNYTAARRPDLIATTTIISNYLALALLLAAFYRLYRGSVELMATLKKPAANLRHWLLDASFLVFCLLYVWATLANPARQFAAETGGRAAYYLPDFLLATTIIIPYIFLWFFGIRAAYHIYLYSKRVKGVIYRQGLGLVAMGIVSVVICSMGIRFLASLSTLLGSLKLRGLLAMIYILLLAISIGYILVAVGAKKLQKIEEV